MNSKIDFQYAFGTPHRLTVALPDSSGNARYVRLHVTSDSAFGYAHAVREFEVYNR